MATLTGHAGGVAGVDVAPSGSIVSASNDSSVKVFSLSDSEAVHTQHGAAVTALSFSADGVTLFSGSEDTLIKV